MGCFIFGGFLILFLGFLVVLNWDFFFVCFRFFYPQAGERCHHFTSEVDDAKHTLLECQAWEVERLELAAALESPVDVASLVPSILKSKYK